MSGFEVLDHLIKIDPRFAHMPFIFLTGLTDQDNEFRERHLGADEYIIKPIDFDVDDPRLVILRPAPPPLQPAQNLDPHRLMTLKLDLRSHASRNTARQTRRRSSDAYPRRLVPGHPDRLTDHVYPTPLEGVAVVWVASEFR